MDKYTYQAVMAASKIAFYWNSNEGSYEQFRKDMSDLLMDIPEDKLMRMARRVGNATDNDTAANDTTGFRKEVVPEAV